MPVISSLFIDKVQFDDCDETNMIKGQKYVVYTRNIKKGTGGEYFYGTYNRSYYTSDMRCIRLYSHEFTDCKFYTNAQSGTLKRIDLVKPVVDVIHDREFIVRKSSTL